MSAETHKDLKQGSSILFKDEMPTATPLLSPAALEALSKKAHNQVVQIPGTMEAYICIYLSVIVRSENIGKGVAVICKALNDLAASGLIHSCLAPVGSLELVKTPLQAQTSAVFAFVLVPGDRKEEAETLAGCCLEEGGVGNPLESLEIQLAEDEFLAEVRLSGAAMIMSDKKLEDRVQDVVAEYLNVLPKDTEVVSITPCAVVDMSHSYEVRFRNPLMKAYKTVELVYAHNATVIDDKVIQFSLLRAVEYTMKAK